MPSYVKQSWVDGVAGGTPISAARLAHIEDGIGEPDKSVTTIRVKSSPAVDIMHPDFGAVPDTDSTTAIQAAVTEAKSTGAPLLIPNYTFRVSAPILWAAAANSGIHMFGAGFNSRLLATNAIDKILSLDQGVSNFQGMIVENLRFDMGENTGKAIHVVSGGQSGKLSGLHIQGFNENSDCLIDLGFSVGLTLEELNIKGEPGTGPVAIKFTGDQHSLTIKNSRFAVCKSAITNAATATIGSDLLIQDCIFDANGTDIDLNSFVCHVLGIKDNRFEKNAAYVTPVDCINLQGFDAISNFLHMVDISGNYFTGLSAVAALSAVHLQRVAGLNFAYNEFSGGATAGMPLTITSPLTKARISRNLVVGGMGAGITGGSAFFPHNSVELEQVSIDLPAQYGVYKALTYGTTVATNAWTGTHFFLNVTDAVAFTMLNPTSVSASSGKGSVISYDIKNSSGGAMGAITWGAAFKLAGAFVNPADTFRRTIQFYWDGTNWVELNRTQADI